MAIRHAAVYYGYTSWPWVNLAITMLICYFEPDYSMVANYLLVNSEKRGSAWLSFTLLSITQSHIRDTQVGGVLVVGLLVMSFIGERANLMIRYQCILATKIQCINLLVALSNCMDI